jgi:hypothetical protein
VEVRQVQDAIAIEAPRKPFNRNFELLQLVKESISASPPHQSGQLQNDPKSFRHEVEVFPVKIEQSHGANVESHCNVLCLAYQALAQMCLGHSFSQTIQCFSVNRIATLARKTSLKNTLLTSTYRVRRVILLGEGMIEVAMKRDRIHFAQGSLEAAFEPGLRISAP